MIPVLILTLAVAVALAPVALLFTVIAAAERSYEGRHRPMDRDTRGRLRHGHRLADIPSHRRPTIRATPRAARL